MLVCLTAFAQNMRSVRGLVADENGKAMPSVTLKADGCPDVFTTDRQGRFDIKVPVTDTHLPPRI